MTSLPESDSDPVRRIEALAEAEDFSGPAVQSVLNVVTGEVVAVLSRERVVFQSAISLAHRELLAELVTEAEEMEAALRGLMSVDSVPSAADSGGTDETWWFALAEATQGLEAAIERLSIMVSVQPKGATVRDLVGPVVRLMRQHQRTLLDEASRWIDG